MYNILGSHSQPRLRPNSVGNIEINIQTHQFSSHNPSDNYGRNSTKFIDSDTKSMIDGPLGIPYTYSLNNINTSKSDNDNDNYNDDTANDKEDDHHSSSNSNPFSFDKLLSCS